MNPTNIKRVRDVIAANDASRFDMMNWPDPEHTRAMAHQGCGTSACIGGWAEALVFSDNPRAAESDSGDNPAREFMGLSGEEAEDLFFMDKSRYQYGSATQPAAILVLDHLLETGEVDWDWAIEEANRGVAK